MNLSVSFLVPFPELDIEADVLAKLFRDRRIASCFWGSWRIEWRRWEKGSKDLKKKAA